MNKAIDNGILPVILCSMNRYNIPYEIVLKIIFEFKGLCHKNSDIIKTFEKKTNPLECTCLYINMNKYNPYTGLRQGPIYEVIKCDICTIANSGIYVNDEDEDEELNLEMLDLIQCENCGNTWDGNAQCMCINYSDIEYY